MRAAQSALQHRAACNRAARRGEYIVKVSLTTAIVAPIKTAMHARVSLKKM